MSSDSSADGLANRRNTRREIAILCLGLATLLAGFYLLSFSGIYHSNDEVGYVRDAVKILREGPSRLGHSGPFAALLAVVLSLAQPIKAIGTLQTLFLVNVGTTIVAAVFLFLVGVRLEYDRRAAVLLALLYGLASPVWVYSKMLFRDPFVGAVLIGMAYFLVTFRVRGSLWSLGLAFLFGAIAVATRPSTAIAAPFAFVYVVAALRSQPDRHLARPRFSRLAAIIISVVLLLVVGWAVTMVFLLYTRWLDRLVRFFDHWDALAGLLVSPGRGILFYAPIVVLALIGLVRFARKHPWETVLTYGPMPFYLLMVSAHPMWWGGWNWGPRYFVPFLPYLLLPMISLIEPLVAPGAQPARWRGRRWLAAAAVAAIVLLSIVTQIVGVSLGPSTPAFENMDPDSFFTWYFMPLVNLYGLRSGVQINADLAWMHLGGNPTDVALVVVPALAVVCLSALLLWRVLAAPALPESGPAGSQEGNGSRSGAGLLAAALAILALTFAVAGWSLARYSAQDLRYQSPAGYAAALQRVAADAQPGDGLIFDHWVTDDVHIFPSRVDNYCRGECPPAEDLVRRVWEITPDEQKVRTIYRLRGSYDRVWLLPATGLYERNFDTEIRPWLDANLYPTGCQQFSQETNLCLYYNLMESRPVSTFCYAAPIQPWSPSPHRVLLPLVSVAGARTGDSAQNCLAPGGQSAVVFDDQLGLRDVRLRWPVPAESAAANDRAPGEPIEVAAGEPLFIDLKWDVLATPDKQYNLSVQLLNEAGQLSHQMDRQPLEGMRSTAGWLQGETLPDRFAFALPASLPAGQYQLVLVVYDPQTGQRLSVDSGALPPSGAADTLKLADVQVAPAAAGAVPAQ